MKNLRIQQMGHREPKQKEESMFDKNGQPLYKQEGPKFTKAMKSQFSQINMPVVYDPTVKSFGLLKDHKQF